MDNVELSKILKVNLTSDQICPQYVNNDRLNYQRLRIEKRVAEILANHKKEFSKPSLVILGRRKNGSFYCINGQHHCEAAIRLDTATVKCYVFDSKGTNHEKKVFNRFQKWQKRKERV